MVYILSMFGVLTRQPPPRRVSFFVASVVRVCVEVKTLFILFVFQSLKEGVNFFLY